MSRSIVAALLLVLAPVASAEGEARIAYGDTPQFWQQYALVVGTVVQVRNQEAADSVETVVDVSIDESVPNRYVRGTKFSMTFVWTLGVGPVRDRPQYATDLQTGNRVMLMVTEEKGKLVSALARVLDYRLVTKVTSLKPQLIEKPTLLETDGFHGFAMLPGFRLNYPKEEDALVAETVRVARALSEKNPSLRLKLIEDIQQGRPEERVEDLLRRSLESTLKSSLQDAEESKRLLRQAGQK